MAESPINITGRVLILPGLGQRAFGPALQIVTAAAMSRLAVIDVDGDGVLDIIGGDANGRGGELSVLAGLGEGEFADVESFYLPGGLADIADLTNDGRPDALYAGEFSRGLLVNTSNSPVAELKIGNVTVSEAEGVALVTVLRSGAPSAVVTATARPLSRTAIVGQDVAAGPIPLRFAPGETVQVIGVPLIDDSVAEPVETFSLTLDDVVGAVPLARRPTVTILDPDPTTAAGATVITAAGQQTRERDLEVRFTVTRSGDLSGESAVNFEVVPGTARVGTREARDDYWIFDNNLDGQIRFAPGESTVVVAIRAFEDDIPEPTETVYMILSAPTGATLDTRVVQASILASDTDVPTVSASASPQTEGDTGRSTGRVVLTLDVAVRFPVTVLVQTDPVASTARAGTDYQAAQRWVTISPGQRRLTVPVTVFGDTRAEPDETVVLTVAPVGGIPVAGGGRAVLTILDDD